MDLEHIAEKLYHEQQHLDRIFDVVIAEPTLTNIELAVSQAKRVRRVSNITVRELAKVRDELQP